MFIYHRVFPAIFLTFSDENMCSLSRLATNKTLDNNCPQKSSSIKNCCLKSLAFCCFPTLVQLQSSGFRFCSLCRTKCRAKRPSALRLKGSARRDGCRDHWKSLAQGLHPLFTFTHTYIIYHIILCYIILHYIIYYNIYIYYIIIYIYIILLYIYIYYYNIYMP